MQLLWSPSALCSSVCLALALPGTHEMTLRVNAEGVENRHVASAPQRRATQTTAPPGARAPARQQGAPPSARWAISLSLILGCLTHSVMMGSINIAVPSMMTSLRADVTQIQWVLTSFMIARTVVMPTLSWLGGLLGNRRLYLTSLTVYLAASMLCGLSWNLETMILFRVLQGLSAGYLTPLGMAILHETYPPGKRGMAMGVFMAGMSFGPAIGPSLGGYLVEHLSWRAVFYINLPIGLIALLGALAGHPPRERTAPRTGAGSARSGHHDDVCGQSLAGREPGPPLWLGLALYCHPPGDCGAHPAGLYRGGINLRGASGEPAGVWQWAIRPRGVGEFLRVLYQFCHELPPGALPAAGLWASMLHTPGRSCCQPRVSGA